MDEEGRAPDFGDQVDIPEVVSDRVLSHGSGLLAHDVPNRSERTHQQQSARVSLARYPSRRPGADGTTEQNDLIFFYALDDGQVIIKVLSVQ